MKRLTYASCFALVAFCSLVSTLNAFVLRPLSLTCTRTAHHHVTTTCRQMASSSSSSVVDRLDLDDNFNRWRFLQNFLDGEIQASDANQVVYSVLDSFLKFPPPPDSSEVVSPILTSNVRDVIQELLEKADDDASIPAFVDPDCSPGDVHVLQQLEKLLPDARDNEDAFKGSWDTVMELHGREAVKINEGKRTPQWQALCMVARVLIYFDFMTRGVPTAQ